MKPLAEVGSADKRIIRLQYEHLRRSGEFNMFMEQGRVLRKANESGFYMLVNYGVQDWWAILDMMNNDPVSDEEYAEWCEFHELEPNG